MLRLHRPRYPLDRAYAQNTSNWLLAAGSTHEGTMAGGNSCCLPIKLLQHRVLASFAVFRKDEVLVER